MKMEFSGGLGHSPVLRTLPLSGSLNTVYAVRYAHPNCAFGTTSHTPKPLAEIAP